MREASGEYVASSPRHIGNTSGQPPSTPTVYKRAKSAYDSREDRNRTRLLLGIQLTATSAPGWKVKRRGSPPSAGMMKTSTLPSYCPVKAIHFPSGEKIGSPS